MILPNQPIQDRTDLKHAGNDLLEESSREFVSTTLGILSAACLVALIAFVYLALTRPAWQFDVLVGGFALTSVLGISGTIGSRKSRYTYQNLAWVSNCFAFSLLCLSVLIAGFALPAAIVYLIFSLILTSITISGQNKGVLTIILGLVLSAGIALAGTYFTAYQITLQESSVIIPGLLSIVIMIYVALLIIQFIAAPLQVRLTTAFLAIVIVPLSIVSLVLNQVSLNKIRNNTYQSLSATAGTVSVVLDKFINNNLSIINQEAQTPSLAKYLSAPRYMSEGTDADREMQATLNLLQTRESDERQSLSSYALLNATGRNVFDTDKNNIGRFENIQNYFIVPKQTGRPYFSQVIYDETGTAFVYFSAPVKDLNQQVLGVLRAKYNALVFQRLAVNYSGLNGFDSFAMIIDENQIRIADAYKPSFVFRPIENLTNEQIAKLKEERRLPDIDKELSPLPSPELARLLHLDANTGTALINVESSTLQEARLPEALAYASMSVVPWKVVYLKADYDQRPIENQQIQSTVLIASVVSLIVGLISIVASRLLASPIVSLTETAHRISAGDLNTRAELTGNDEFGTLGSAFNLMTERMNSFINELEDRVAQRTLELERRNEILQFRSNQLQTVSEVARTIVSAQELQNLLESVTQLVSSRFGFYHVGIFLVDENRELAILRAANSEGGKRMLAHTHALKVGKIGIVGYVTGTGEPRIATDVGDDAVFFNNPDLPLTRSEMALPLRIGDEIIGAMDVQSTESNAFTRDDIDLFSILADQVSIAIYNNRLYNETVRALAEAQAVHRQYLRQEWNNEINTRKTRSYRYTSQGTVPVSDETSEIVEAFTTGQPITQLEEQNDGTTKATLAVPIQLRGETIGVIRVQDKGENRSWSESETFTVQDIAQQVGVALENARLFEKSVSRAERERKVLEITGRIRATNDPQEMLEIAAMELQRALGATRAQIYVRQPVQASPIDNARGNGHPSAE